MTTTFCDHCEKPVDITDPCYGYFVETIHVVWCDECKVKDGAMLDANDIWRACSFYNINHPIMRSFAKIAPQ
jgi:hypothetical protein